MPLHHSSVQAPKSDVRSAGLPHWRKYSENFRNPRSFSLLYSIICWKLWIKSHLGDLNFRRISGKGNLGICILSRRSSRFSTLSTWNFSVYARHPTDKKKKKSWIDIDIQARLIESTRQMFPSMPGRITQLIEKDPRFWKKTFVFQERKSWFNEKGHWNWGKKTLSLRNKTLSSRKFTLAWRKERLCLFF